MHNEYVQIHLAAGKRVAAAATMLTALLAICKGSIGQLHGAHGLLGQATGCTTAWEFLSQRSSAL